MYQKHVVIMGNPNDGFEVIGPFESKGYAIDYLGTDPSKGENMWVMPLHAPASDEEITGMMEG